MKIENNVLIQVDEDDLDNKLGFVVPEGIQKIAGFAFVSCKRIKTVVMPQSVVAIGVSAFDGCSDLECVHLSNQIRIIGMHAFRYCRKLNQIHLPDKLETLCEGAFSVTGLTEITVPDSVVRMDDFIFAYCYELEKAKLPRHLETFGERLFYDCRILAQVSLPENLLGLPAHTFMHCRKLGTVSVPASVRKIGREAFNGCHSLKEIELSDGLNVIERHTFHGCERLLHATNKDYTLSELFINENVACIPSDDTFGYAHIRFGNILCTIASYYGIMITIGPVYVLRLTAGDDREHAASLERISKKTFTNLLKEATLLTQEEMEAAELCARGTFDDLR